MRTLHCNAYRSYHSSCCFISVRILDSLGRCLPSFCRVGGSRYRCRVFLTATPAVCVFLRYRVHRRLHMISFLRYTAITRFVLSLPRPSRHVSNLRAVGTPCVACVSPRLHILPRGLITPYSFQSFDLNTAFARLLHNFHFHAFCRTLPADVITMISASRLAYTPMVRTSVVRFAVARLYSFSALHTFYS